MMRSAWQRIDRKWWQLIWVSSLTGMVGLIYWTLIYRNAPIGIDDANIYFVYIRNLAEGHGMVYNIGGERVEGFTSSVWVWMAALLYMGTGMVALPLALLNWVVISLALWKAVQFLGKLNGETHIFPASGLALLGLLYVTPGYLEWTLLTLMETGLWSALLLLTTLSLVKYHFHEDHKKTSKALSIWLPLLVITRPESLLWGLVYLTVWGWTLWGSEKFSLALKRIILPMLTFGGTVAALTGWRLFYFASLFPNTYYAKVSSDKISNAWVGVEYIVTFFYEIAPVAIVPVTIAILLLLSNLNKYFLTNKYKGWRRFYYWFNRKHKDWYRSQLTLSMLLVVGLLIPCYTGGDHFALGRFYQPLLPIWFMLMLNHPFWQNLTFASGWKEKLTTTRISPFIWLSMGLLLVSVLPRPNIYLLMLRHAESPLMAEFDIAEDGREFGEVANELFSTVTPKPSLGVVAAGGVAYTYSGEIVDLLGLNNVAMARADKIKRGKKSHASFNKSVFFQQKPELMGRYFGGQVIHDVTSFQLHENLPSFDQSSYENRLLKGIFRDPPFIESYQPVLIS
ncbi:MAG: hypothetical protein AAGI38_06530, partial [Bacteroidota bacterium]